MIRNDVAVLTDNALKVLAKRYLRKDESRNVIETPVDMFQRVAFNIALAEKELNPKADVESMAERFFSMISSLYFMPNSPTLMNAGRELQQLSACFVLPVEDSIDSIFDGVKNTALIHKSGGGTGFSFSRIRPKNDIVRSTKGASSGPVSFMSVFNAATEVIKQGGTRRGANMGILRIDHPDIEEFIVAKQNNDSFTNFNISVAVTDAFMECVEQDRDFPLINPHSGAIVQYISARKLFDRITSMAWKNGEPGIVFIDQINRYNPTPHIATIESTNPCGEQPLLPYESCNLGSINLGMMVEKGAINYEKLEDIIRTSVRFLDNVIERNNFPLPEIKRMTRGNRKIGLGVMGFADMLIKLGISYNSDEALETADQVMSFVNRISKQASEELAIERGPFPNFAGSIWDTEGHRPIRNATTTTIAPTGTISIIANASSGIEPLFAVSYIRKNVLDGEEMLEVNPLFESMMRARNLYSDELMKRIAQSGTIQDMTDIPESIRSLFVTAHDVKPDWHIRMQAAFQKHTDNAVSKTVNLPHSATVKDVENIYWLAFRLGCKGVTVYRDGSRDQQVLNIGKAAETAHETEQPESVNRRPRYQKRAPRPTEVFGVTREMQTGCGKLYITMNANEHGLFEVFANMGKAGGCAASQTEAIGRLVSLALRTGIHPQAIVDDLIGISCHQPYGFGETKVRSCADAIAKAILHYLQHQPASQQKTASVANEAIGTQLEGDLNLSCGACPDCGGCIEHESGCIVCRNCGYSACS